MILFKSIEADALEKLNEAKVLLANTVACIEETAGKLEKKDHRLIKLEFIYGSISNLLELFNKCKREVEIKIGTYLKDREGKVDELIVYLNDLQDVSMTLKKIKVDPTLNDSNKTLYDFINWDSITEISDYILECEKEYSKGPSKTFTDSIEMRLFNEWKYLSQEWEPIQNNYNKHMNSEILENHIQMLLDNNNSLEMESVELLQGLNDHWDKCMLYNKSPSNELLQILQDDYTSLPSVMQLLDKNSTIISQNCKDITRYLSNYETIKTQFITFLTEIQDFNVEVMSKQIESDLLLEFNKIDQIRSKIVQYKTELLGYKTDFFQFAEAYYNLLLELERRRKSNDRINKIIKKFQYEVGILSEQESMERDSFFSLNADFIPQDLIKGTVINSSYPEVNVNYKTEDIPEISSKLTEEVKNILTTL